MKHSTLIASATALVACLVLAGMARAALPASNPFAAPSTLPLQYPAFDRIGDADYAPAFAEGMREQAAEIARIAGNRAPPTFDNTIVAMERSGRLLNRVSTVFFSLNGANTNATLQALDRVLAPRLSAHGDAILLDARLYARVKKLYDRRAMLGLDPESRYLLERYHTDFVRAGAQLSAADKARLKGYNAQLAVLQSAFAQNVLKEMNASALVVDTRAALDGLSDAQIARAASDARARGLEGKYAIPIVNTTGQAPLSVLKDRATRERLLAASMARGSRGGDFDNRALVLQLVKLRAERAALLGYASHADYHLADQTAKSTAAVNTLLAEFAQPAVRNARREAAAIQKVIDAEQSGGFALAAHDWQFYADKVSRERYAFDQNELKPYFELDSVLQHGVFYAANQVFGLTFRERSDLPVYQADVRVWDVFDADGRQLAIFVGDFYARGNKRGGAWMNAYVNQSRLLGTQPVVANHLNIPKPADGDPTLLTYDEVRTAFHEFGHALHGMLSDVRYPRFSGTRVPRDFVEFPSQVNEMWATWPDILHHYARHYRTGEPMPKALLDKVLAAAKFNEGHRTTEYLAAALLDQKWHQLGAGQVPADVTAFEAQALKDAGVDFAPVPPRYRTTYFSHVFSGGYAAGYYGYLWAEKLDADTVGWFRENGGPTRRNGDWFRRKLLSKGGTMDAMQMFREFRGRDAQVGPLLERRGLND